MLLNNLLKEKIIILASGSPRRKELLQGLGLNFIVDTKNHFEEKYPQGMEIRSIPEYLAKGKSHGYHRPLLKNEIVITADTMVLCKEEILGKPKDKADAVRMLNLLQDCKHTVLTGVCIRDQHRESSFTVSTDVFFNKLTDAEIEYYILNYKPYDKAGAYGVQEWIGYIGINRIDGSYYNVMGLPVQRLYNELRTFMIDASSPV